MIDIITILLSIVAIIISAWTYRASVIYERKKATLDAYNQLQEQALDEINMYMPSEIKEIIKDVKSSEYKKLSVYIARVEHFCVGLNNKIYDMNTFYELAHGYFDDERGILLPRMAPLLERKNKQNRDYYGNIKQVLSEMYKISERGGT